MGAGHIVTWFLLLVLGAATFLCWIGALIAGVIGLRRKSRPLIAIGIAGVLSPAGVCILLWYLSTPSQTFRNELGVFPPREVKNLEVEGAFWNNAIFMRFEAPRETISSLLDSEYTKVRTFDVPDSDIQAPAWWKPVITEATEIYQKSSLTEDEWPEESTLITDPSSGVTFYLGLHSD